MKSYKFIFCVFLLSLCLIPCTGAQISRDDIPRYLESGEISYQISVRFHRVDRIQPEEARRRCGALETALRGDPENPRTVLQLLEAYQDAGMYRQRAETAETCLDNFQQRYKRDPTEENARYFLAAATAAGNDTLSDTAYQSVLPFLETGTAALPTVLCAAENRTSRGSDALAYRILDFYQGIYPEEPELYFQAFLITLTASLYKTIPDLLKQVFSSVQTSETVSEDELKGLFARYFSALENAVYLELIGRAIELDPGNYQYYLASAGFRSLVKWFSLIGGKMISGEQNGLDLQTFFTMLNAGDEAVIRDHLDKALQLRPEPDVQVFLAAALYSATLGDAEAAEQYARNAVSLRPDSAEGYDALVYAALLGNIGEEHPVEKTAIRIEKILLNKIRGSGGNAYDYYVLSSLQKIKFERSEPGGQERLLSEMLRYAEESLSMKQTVLGFLAEGNAYLLSGSPELALELYKKAEELGEGEYLDAVYTNRGIAFLFTGERERGIAELQKALQKNPQSENAEAVLKLYRQ